MGIYRWVPQQVIAPYLVETVQFSREPLRLSGGVSMAAGQGLMMDQFDVRSVEDCQAVLTHFQAEIDIVAGDHKAYGFEAAYLLENLSTDAHKRAGHGSGGAIAKPAPQRARLARTGAEPFMKRCPVERAQRHACMLNMAGRIEKPRSDQPDLGP